MPWARAGQDSRGGLEEQQKEQQVMDNTSLEANKQTTPVT